MQPIERIRICAASAELLLELPMWLCDRLPRRSAITISSLLSAQPPIHPFLSLGRFVPNSSLSRCSGRPDSAAPEI